MSDRYLDFKHLDVGTYSLHDYEAALDALRKGEISKAVFEFRWEISRMYVINWEFDWKRRQNKKRIFGFLYIRHICDFSEAKKAD